MPYTSRERALFVRWFIESRYDYAEFSKTVHLKLGINARVPDRKSIKDWDQKFLETGNVDRTPVKRIETVRDDDTIAEVFGAVQDNQHISVRSLANQFDISIGSTHRILREDLVLHPYKAQTAQELLPGDPETRSQFARRMMAERLVDPELAQNLVFFDEAHFHEDGVPNRQNFRIWGSSNPSFIVQEPLHSARVTALIGMGYHGIIGPFFFDGNVNAQRYLEMLENQVLPALRLWPNFGDIVLVQDGAPAHWALTVRAFLNRHFPMRWIGRSSPFIVWPPRSPDLTPLDFFIWGYLKERLYRGQHVPSLEVLMRWIENEAGQIPLDMLRRALENFWERLLVCEVRGGLNVETRE